MPKIEKTTLGIVGIAWTKEPWETKGESKLGELGLVLSHPTSGFDRIQYTFGHFWKDVRVLCEHTNSHITKVPVCPQGFSTLKRFGGVVFVPFGKQACTDELYVTFPNESNGRLSWTISGWETCMGGRKT